MGNLRGLCQSCHNRRSANGTNAEPRAVGCNADGMPRDPGHPWLTWGANEARNNVARGEGRDFCPGTATAGGVARALSSKIGRRGS